jgi:hypothetical protein
MALIGIKGVGVRSDQDRHFMMQSPPIRHRSHPSDSRRISNRPRLRRPVRLDRIASAILLNNPPVRPVRRERTLTPRAKAMDATAPPHSL